MPNFLYRQNKSMPNDARHDDWRYPAMGVSYTPIKMEWFYYLEGERTKLNWFLLEIALEYYGRIRDCTELAQYREQYDEKQIAQFCAYFARRLKKNLLNCIKGRRKTVVIDQEHINDFYPHLDNWTSNLLTSAARDAVGHMLSACEHCPQQCLTDYQSTSLSFDTHRDWSRPR